MNGLLAISWNLWPPSASITVLVVLAMSLIGCLFAFRRPVWDRSSLIAQTITLVIGEAAIYSFYIGFRQPFHWANHFFPAVVVASLIYLIFLLKKKRPMRGEIILILPLHLFAMVPDPLFSFNTFPHEGWMNIFAGHIWVHFLPGRLTGWLVLAIVTSGIYVWRLTRWLARGSSNAAPAPASSSSLLA